MTMPLAFVTQNDLHEGSRVRLEIEGSRLVVVGVPTKRTLAELMAEQRAVMGEELPRVPDWDDMPAVGQELF